MKTFALILIMFSFATYSNAEETLTEKTKATANSAKRSAKKGWNRTKESVCGKLTGDSKAECLAKEAKHRAEEAKDSVTDKAKEIKNSIDSDDE